MLRVLSSGSGVQSFNVMLICMGLPQFCRLSLSTRRALLRVSKAFPVLLAFSLHQAGSAQGKQGCPSSAGSPSPTSGLCSRLARLPQFCQPSLSNQRALLQVSKAATVLPALPLHPAASAQGKQGGPSFAGSPFPPSGLCSR